MRRPVVIPGALLLLVGATLLLGARTAPAPQLVLVRRAHYVMGTIFEISARGSDRNRIAVAVEQAFACIRRADEVMSHYRPQSDLMRLNQWGYRGPVQVPEELYSVLQDSVRYGELSGGALDVTVGPLVRLWEAAAARGSPPTPEELTVARARVGFHNIKLLRNGEVALAVRGTEINLGAIGKGWALDRAAQVLRAHGVRHAFLSAGTSTVLAMGSDGQTEGWLVEIRDSCSPEQVIGSVRLRDTSLSTSAAYEQFWQIQGQTYSHILDPRTGQPVEPLAGVSVIAPTATETDALSTAVYVLGAQKGRDLLRRLQRAAVMVERNRAGCVLTEVNYSADRDLFPGGLALSHGQE